MRDHYGLAQRASDDGTLMYAPVHCEIPKLSLRAGSHGQQDLELGERHTGVCGRLAALPSSRSCSYCKICMVKSRTKWNSG